jgi:hypothetical protein
MGDLAFIINVQYKHFLLTEGPHGHFEQGKDTTLQQWNVFCNICTVNYILAGLHNYAVFYATNTVDTVKNNQHAWYRVMQSLNIHNYLHTLAERYTQEKLINKDVANDLLTLRCKIIPQEVVRINMIPIGICSMSEKQGGQHEVGLKPVQAAASFFTTLTVDCQNRDLVNIWRAVDLNAGDFLTLQLQVHSIRDNRHVQFVLNHYYKGTVAKTFMFGEQIHKIQLVPTVSTMNALDKTQIGQMRNTVSTLLAPAGSYAESYSNILMHALQFPGYWHIGQTYTKKTAFSDQTVPVNDTIMTRGQLLQINFAPVWKGIVSMPSEHNGGIELDAMKSNPMFFLHCILFERQEIAGGTLIVTNAPTEPDGTYCVDAESISSEKYNNPTPHKCKYPGHSTGPSSEASFDPDALTWSKARRAEFADVSKNITLEKLLMMLFIGTRFSNLYT